VVLASARVFHLSLPASQRTCVRLRSEILRLAMSGRGIHDDSSPNTLRSEFAPSQPSRRLVNWWWRHGECQNFQSEQMLREAAATAFPFCQCFL
jgi:hypothetical protein